MTKKIVIPCVINGQISPLDFYIGTPAEGSDPIHFQTKWVGSAKQGSVPPHVLQTLTDLKKLSLETGANFEDLCDLIFNKKDESKS